MVTHLDPSPGQHKTKKQGGLVRGGGSTPKSATKASMESYTL
jgi:hypothetical protein